MAMRELTKEQKVALVVSRMARTVAHHEARGGSSRTICQSAALCSLTTPQTRQFERKRVGIHADRF